ncbi:LysR family transcriptional regulator [Flintibacter faecis]|uniref:LysR family transcriptional regulator n=1 Tax=Flintibacter faecis TaxID=2763047 RepID=A0A8J6J2G2_9FIRM|nr:LysR family transcriptional regulator [Flintibacter faecis]MBC5715991.1 LysR family transcriptional regulator [Flintibacter faecis]
MSMTAYRLFCVIAEERNMSRAAQQLHITPSAATHAMNALERSLGFPLLNRDRNGVSLTSYGELLLPKFQAVLEEEERLRGEAAKINGLEQGRIRLGVLDSVCTNWLPGILTSFQQKYPHIEVQVYQDGYQSIESMLLEGVLDMGFVSLPASERFSTITLVHDRLLCIAPQGFTPKDPPYVTPDDLRGHPLLLSHRGYDRSLEQYLTQNQLEPCHQHNITLESSVIALVEGGMGVSIVPELVLQTRVGHYQTFPLEDNIYRTIALATLRGRHISLASEKMIQEIRDHVKFL